MSTFAQQEQIDWNELQSAAGPYPIEAFRFVSEGLHHTADRIHGGDEGLHELDRHVSGQQLCLGLRDYAIGRYGLLAPVVLEHWHIHRTDDFGRIVFAMITHNMLSKTSDDSVEDFRAVYDFDEAFSTSELVAYLSASNSPAPA